VTDDYGRRQTFNTAIAASMELLNTTTKFRESNKDEDDRVVVQEALEIVILMLAPIVPHFSHALWNQLGHKNAVIDEFWPTLDEEALAQDSVVIVIQVNGKMRDKIEVSKTISKEELEQKTLQAKSVKRFIDGKKVHKIIVVPDRLVNVVAS
jgi:leucyl-tRNA synthetase